MQRKFKFKFISMLLALSIILSPVSMSANNIASAMENNMDMEEAEQSLDSGVLEDSLDEHEEESEPEEKTEEKPEGEPKEEPKEETEEPKKAEETVEETNKFELQEAEETPFEFDEETGAITGYKGGKPPVNLVIPEEINGVPVKSIGYRAFYYSTYGGTISTQIKTLELPEGIEVIGGWAFQGNLLEKIILPDSITELSERTFFGNKLTEIEFSNSLKSIGNSAFMQNQLKEIEIPSHIEEIQEGAFKTNLLTDVILHEGLETIGANAFEDNQIDEIIIPDTVVNWPSTGSDYSIFRRNGNGRTSKILYLVKVYNTSGATAKNTFGIVNPAAVTIEYKDSKGEEIASSKTIVGRELKKAEKQGSAWVAVEGSGNDLLNYDVDKTVTYNLIKVIDEISENYYQMNQEYTFEPIEIEEYKTPEPQTATLDKKENTIIFTYTKEGEEPADPAKPAGIELSFPGGKQVTPLNPGGKQIIFAKVLNGNGEEVKGENVTFESSDPDVLKFSFLDTFTAGEVTEETTVTITATLTSNPKIKSVIDVTVTPKAEETLFEFDKETGTVKGYKENEEMPSNLVIPEKINGAEVKHIGDKAFYSKKNIKAISFPKTLETIGEEAFRHCELGEISIPGNIKEIKKDAFNNAGLSKVTFEEGIEKLGANSFGSNSIDMVVLPDTVDTWPSEGNDYSVFSANKIKIGDWTGKLKFVRVYNSSGATPRNTFGIINPASVTLQYKDEDGGIIKDSQTITGKELKKAKNIGTSWEPKLEFEEGSKEYLIDYNDPYDIGWGMVLGLGELSSNYYQMNQEYTFEPIEIEGYKTPEPQTATLDKKENTITFTYTKEGEGPAEPVTPVDLDEEIDFLIQCYEAYMTEDSSGSTGNAGLSMMATGAARLAGMDAANIQKHIYIDKDNKSAYQLSQSIITLIGADLDPRQYNDKGKIRNLVKELEESQQTEGENKGEFVKADSDKNSVEAQARSVIALDMAGGSYNEEIVAKLMEIYDKKDGSHTYKDIKTEGIMLIALSNHKDIAGVQAKIDEILAYLKTKQNKDGGFDIVSGHEKGTNSPTATGRVIQGLMANGINPSEDEEWIKNGSTMLHAIIKSKTVKDDMKKSGYGRGVEDEYTYYEATYTAFGALMDLRNQESMFELLRLNTDPGSVPVKVEIAKPDKNEIEVGQSLILTAKVYDKDGKVLSGQELIWESSDSSIAKVKDGNAAAIGTGTVTITAKVKDTEIQDTFKITVVEEIKALEVNTAIIVFDEDGEYEVKSAPKKVTVNKDEHDGGLTVFGALQATIGEYEGTGSWITSIYGITGPSSGGWMFSVNGETPMVVAGQAKVKAGDKIIWFCTYDYDRDKAPAWEELAGEEPEEKLSIKIVSGKSVKVGEELPLSAEVRKGSTIVTDKDILWLSSDAGIAAIKDGKLKAHKAGEVNITAALAEDKNINDTVKIKVTEAGGEDITLEEVIEALRKYYSDKDEFTFRAALGYNFTSDNPEKDLAEIAQKIKTNENPKTASEHVGNILGLIAAGKDPYNYNNKDYVKTLSEAQNKDGKFIIGQSDDYPTTVAFSMLALDMAGAEYNRDKAADALLGYQNTAGSFGGADETAMALTALAKYKDEIRVQTAIDKGLNYLKGEQDAATGGFIAWDSENPYSSSAVLQGLIAAGEDPLSEKWTVGGKTAVDSLMNYYKDGYFENESEWGSDIDMVTEQAFIALADVYIGKSMFNEMKFNANEAAGIKINKPEPARITEGETIILFVTGYDEKGQIVPVKEIEWSSSDDAIAEVDADGNVKAKKPGKVSITAKIKDKNIEDSIVLEIAQKEFEIKYTGDLEAKNGKQADATVKIINLTDYSKPATLITALYEHKTNRLINYSMVKRELNSREELEISSGFLVPESGSYYIKVFVWDDMEYQNILMQEAKEIKAAN